jgi:putative peptidoglycan lipid II flippase
VRAAFAAVAANIALSLALSRVMGSTGVALASSLAAWVNVAVLIYWLRHHGHFPLDAGFRRRVPRIVAASLAMAAGLVLAARALEAPLAGGLAAKSAALCGLVAGGLAVYGALALALGAVEMGLVRRVLRRRAG